MTQEEWNQCRRSDWMLMPLHESYQSDPAALLWLERKLRLFAIACGRQQPDWLTDPVHWNVLETAEGYANGKVEASELTALQALAQALPDRDSRSNAVKNFIYRLASAPSGMQAAMAAVLELATATGWDHFEDITIAQAPLLRCIVGNPFRPVTLDPSWLTSTVVGLAQGIYDDRAFDRLPILADALEDAGCDHPDILAHCRGEGPHARGCWVGDLLLGKG